MGQQKGGAIVIIETENRIEDDRETVLFPTTKQLISLSGRVRDLINKHDPKPIKVPGQGETWVALLPGSEGKIIQVGWSRIRDEYGALIWTKEGNLMSGDYNVMYVNPYEEQVILCHLKCNGESEAEEVVVGSFDWTAMTEIISLL